VLLYVDADVLRSTGYTSVTMMKKPSAATAELRDAGSADLVAEGELGSLSVLPLRLVGVRRAPTIAAAVNGARAARVKALSHLFSQSVRTGDTVFDLEYLPAVKAPPLFTLLRSSSAVLGLRAQPRSA